MSDDALSVAETARAIERVDAARAGAGGTLTAPAAGGGVAYKFLKLNHPEYDAKYWHRLRAFYKGGRALLGDRELMREIFPPHRKEIGEIYEERCKRAFYVPYAAEILDHIVAGLASDPITVSLGAEGEGDPQQELPEYYKKFTKNVSPQGASPLELSDLIKEQVRTALMLRSAWTLVELPVIRDNLGEPTEFADQAEQEEAGGLDAYAVVLEPETVVDWEEDASGDLEMAILHTASSRRLQLAGGRNQVTQTWTVYTRAMWQRFRVTHAKDKPPRDDDVIPLVEGGPHTFGRVPLLRMQLPEGLWAMNKMEGVAREHFNKRNALAWGELQSLLPELYEFLGPEASGRGAVIGSAQEDPGRSMNMPRGQGFVQVRGGEDSAAFVGPDPGPFAEARQSCDSLRDELHRVMHQMALSVDNTAASVGRSAESKAQDKASVAAILTELGKHARKHAEAVLAMVSRARQEEELARDWAGNGMAKFDAVSVADVLDQALIVDTLRIESETFRKRHREIVVRGVLGDDVTPEDLEAIDRELEVNITADSFVNMDLEESRARQETAAEAAKNKPANGAPGKPAPGKPPPKAAMR